jgi:Na+-translocating ferredoxin:NAD+ oxidoreductase RnfD subunit
MSQVFSPQPSTFQAPLRAPIRSEGGGRNFPRFYLVHMLGSVFPLTAGAILYGWRAMAVLLVSLSSTLLFTAIWQRIGRRGGALHIPHAIWLAILLTMMLPPHLMVGKDIRELRAGDSVWMIVPAGSLLMVMLLWLTGGVGFSRVHPLLITQLLLVLCFYPLLHPHLVLHRTKMLSGDLQNVIYKDEVIEPIRAVPWIAARDEPPTDALYIPKVASQQLIEYTRLKHGTGYGWISVEGLVRDAMPPLEDLVVGGHPGPIGASSAIAIIIGGLFLLYRGLIDYRIPLIAVTVAFFAFLLLPVPAAIRDTGAQWRPLISARIDVATMVTFANYELMASPLLLTLFFLATSPSISPMGRKAKVVFAIALGLLTAALQLYLSCSFGPYVALLLAGLLSPWLDEMFRPRPLI